MKRTIFLLFLFPALLFIMPEVWSQAPMSFSFQAVARNSSGELIADSNLDVRFSLYSGTDVSLVWQETHSVTTSDLGLFVAEVGSGTRTGGSVFEFGDIDWGADRYSLKVELDEGAGWEDMGSSDLLSVPYALNASSVSNIKSLKVNEKEDNPPDSALFEVKNNTGNTVFAVYNEGVRVFVDDNQGKSKGPKGGFAIGGFDNTKGETYEFFRVTPDSVRIYLDEGTTKGPKGGFAIGGFDRAKGLTEDFMHLSEDNYFIGYESGSNVTTGLYNSFFGYMAGVMNASGSSNIFIGNETGYGNIEGNWNILLGNNAGYSNISGSGNIILGDYAGNSNTTGSWNVFMGDLAGSGNSSGSDNVYIGSDAGLSSTIANYNVFIGSTAGYSNTEGSSNVFVGEGSGYANTYGEFNVFMGSNSGTKNTSGNYNVFLGDQSGYENTTGISNVFLGREAGNQNSTGSYNVFLGTLTGYSNTTGFGNVFLGQEAGELNSEGNFNVAIGSQAGYSNTTGLSNVFIGFQAGLEELGSNKLYIDNAGNLTQSALIYGVFDENYLSFNATVDVWEDLWVNGTVYELNNLKSGAKGSSEMTGVLDNIIEIIPYEYEVITSADKSSLKEIQIGFDPEQIKTYFPYLVNTGKTGLKGVNYSKLSVVLLQALKEQQAIIDKQEYRLKELEEKVEMLLNK